MCEIGVYHGRSTIPLYNLTSDETLTVIDTFQSKNQYATFIGNINRAFKSPKLYIITSSSLNVEPGDLGRFRIFSIDGDHSTEATLNDLELAAATLVSGGVMFLDDFENPTYGPAVSAAIEQFLAKYGDWDIAFAHSQRLFIIRKDDIRSYADYMRQKERPGESMRFLGRIIPNWVYCNSL